MKRGKSDYFNMITIENNYRPISVLLVCSQFFLVYILPFFRTTSYCLIPSLVFVKNNSCQTALITLTEEIYNAIQTGNLFGLLQLDLSKAFDLVNHKLLLEKMKLQHCNDGTICWYQSYLEMFLKI